MLGLSTSVLLGQFISIGLADIEGAQHLSKDQGAWLAAVYNAGQMFIGPMTVYIGGLLGPRKVLLVAAPTVAISALLLGLTTSYPIMLTLLAIAGLGCGSFYPLTLTFVARSLPRPLFLFGIAAYGFDVVSSLHVAALLEGWYMQYLSWHWIYWQPALMALGMWALVQAGIPSDPTSSVDTAKLRPSWQSFVYASLGLVCLFLLLSQGVRLNWGTSGGVAALAAAGAFLLLASLISHLLQPNPLVDLRFIFRRNILLLSICLCVLRFSLLSSAQLVPTFLSTAQHFIPLQTGSVLAWVALPSLLCGVLAAVFMKYVDPRLLLAFGFLLTGSACLWDNELTSLWSRQNFFPTELLIGVGAAISVVSLVGCIVLEIVNSGAVKQPIDTLTFVAWFHTVRLFGGEIVSTLMGYLLFARFRFHFSRLADLVNTSRAATATQLLGMTRTIAMQSPSAGSSLALTGALLANRAERQTVTLTIEDAYILEALVIAIALVLVALIGREPLQFKDLLKDEQ
ncbi:Inner membrane component of tripartite multidrug resistance system [Acidisarcina polymorpha]|uniref:Inner membrane component of tripartite multidrug resistance system n=2 Tax=Acidisarcina polymorpha TaxID=2211140 RepID=A0A2Z5FZ56_9BACT|nr:Inner membrane component of tripartite multidrug resistance system [Acidisarcina polymorpha]